jgi:hypothetical protein
MNLFWCAKRYRQRIIHLHHFTGVMNTQASTDCGFIDFEFSLNRIFQTNQHDIDIGFLLRKFSAALTVTWGP